MLKSTQIYTLLTATRDQPPPNSKIGMGTQHNSTSLVQKLSQAYMQVVVEDSR